MAQIKNIQIRNPVFINNLERWTFEKILLNRSLNLVQKATPWAWKFLYNKSSQDSQGQPVASLRMARRREVQNSGSIGGNDDFDTADICVVWGVSDTAIGVLTNDDEPINTVNLANGIHISLGKCRIVPLVDNLITLYGRDVVNNRSTMASCDSMFTEDLEFQIARFLWALSLP